MRRPTIPVVMALLGLMLSTSCSTSAFRSRRANSAAPEENVAQSETANPTLSVGMTASQVRADWGEPREVIADVASPGIELWVYELSKGTATEGRSVVLKTQYRLSFAEGRLTSIEEKPL